MAPASARRLRAARTVDRHGHVGVQAQSQPGLYYIGVVLPIGRMQASQLQGLADIADRYGSGTLRLTVWQNLLVSDIPETALRRQLARSRRLALVFLQAPFAAAWSPVPATSAAKFALSDTKRHALALAEHLNMRLTLDQPINIHFTGCPKSCAQHYVGDIGLLTTKVERGDGEVEGHHVLVGGGSGAETALGREIWASVPADEMMSRVEAMLRAYLARSCPNESFHAFANRHTVEELAAMFGGGAVAQVS